MKKYYLFLIQQLILDEIHNLANSDLSEEKQEKNIKYLTSLLKTVLKNKLHELSAQEKSDLILIITTRIDFFNKKINEFRDSSTLSNSQLDIIFKMNADYRDILKYLVS